jgi:hypothetical protein
MRGMGHTQASAVIHNLRGHDRLIGSVTTEVLQYYSVQSFYESRLKGFASVLGNLEGSSVSLTHITLAAPLR